MTDTLMQLSSLIILFMIFVTDSLVLMAGLIVVAVEAVVFVWKRIFRRGKVYRR